MTSKKEEIEVERTMEDLVKGMQMGINELNKRLESKLNGMTKSELKRAIRSILSYPDTVKTYSEKEATFIAELHSLHGLQLQTEINALAELQLEQENKENSNG